MNKIVTGDENFFKCIFDEKTRHICGDRYFHFQVNGGNLVSAEVEDENISVLRKRL